MSIPSTEIALFATCLVDSLRPSVGIAAIELLQKSGCTVVVPKQQTCCGQPAFNAGNNPLAVQLAKQLIVAFERFAYVVVPSGSCAGMIKEHYPKLLSTEEQWHKRARVLAEKTYELTDFLVNVLEHADIDAEYDGKVCYHDSCAGLRELGIKQQPRTLLSKVANLELVSMQDEEVCCGFGGMFCVKYSQISDAMVQRKVDNVVACKADTLAAGDLGCLFNIAGKLSRENIPVRVWHIAEILAGLTTEPAIGEINEK